MPRTPQNTRALFGVAAVLMAALTAAPARAADLPIPLDVQILNALKAKRLVRCPRVDTRARCGGARLHNPRRTLS